MTEKEQILQGLNFCSTFDSFSAEERNEIAKIALVRRFKAGENIFTIRHKDSYFFLVYKGLLSLRLKTRKVKKYTRGEIFGEVSIFCNQFRSGNIKAIEDSELIAFDSRMLFGGDVLATQTKLKLIRKLTETIIGYLYEDNTLSTRVLIENGEGLTVEYKESLNPKSKSFKHLLVKTLTAFMNSKGGTILIGVQDDGTPVGIDLENQVIDDFMRSLMDIIDHRIGEYSSSLIAYDIDEWRDHKILRIDCDQSMEPIFYKGHDDQELFIIRTGARNKELQNTRDVIRYYDEHFNY